MFTLIVKVNVTSLLQVRIKDKCPFSVYIPCAGHSLNLVGARAAECCTAVVDFFDFLQRLVDAVTALFNGYSEIQQALNKIAEDQKEERATSHEAESLSNKMDKLETAFLRTFWNDILTRYNTVSKTLQGTDVDLSVVVTQLTSLKTFTQGLRDDFQKYEDDTMTQLPDTDYSDATQRTKKCSVRVQCSEGNAKEVILRGAEKFRIETFIPVLDSLLTGLSTRLAAYESMNQLFSFIVSSPTLENEDIRNGCNRLAEFYHQDLDAAELYQECLQFNIDGTMEDAKAKENQAPHSLFNLLYKKIRQDRLESTSPNIEIAIRMFLSTMVTNCKGERIFSKMKIIKGALWSPMTENHLNCLSLLSIECDILQTIDFETLKAEFASRKARKVYIV
ncbi:Zinc finger MYM-type-like protein [Daphnia magna]|uniref:Zinc finger MYM-type-like protein n=1 Tax=Daphnia magna TaxID=35525 RepID=A0A164KQE0_9CRUS|nr:Zinc finger MYM-type-like protein [Daphnia magna]